jgi:hypothetical protein
MGPDSTPIAATRNDLPDPAPFAGQYLDQRTHTIYSFTASNGHLRAWGSDLRRKDANQFYDLLVMCSNSRDQAIRRKSRST